MPSKSHGSGSDRGVAVGPAEIIEVGVDSLDEFKAFCQRCYAETYPRPEWGIVAEYFSAEAFAAPDVDRYFRRLLSAEPGHRAWVATAASGDIIGSVAVETRESECVVSAFYVAPKRQGEGIGSALFQKVDQFASRRTIVIDVLQYMESTISMYEHWGFHVDESRGLITHDWPDWSPEALRHYFQVYMVRPAI